jgi:hypothetical protein
MRTLLCPLSYTAKIKATVRFELTSFCLQDRRFGSN